MYNINKCSILCGHFLNTNTYQQNGQSDVKLPVRSSKLPFRGLQENCKLQVFNWSILPTDQTFHLVRDTSLSLIWQASSCHYQHINGKESFQEEASWENMPSGVFMKTFSQELSIVVNPKYHQLDWADWVQDILLLLWAHLSVFISDHYCKEVVFWPIKRFYFWYQY